VNPTLSRRLPRIALALVGVAGLAVCAHYWALFKPQEMAAFLKHHPAAPLLFIAVHILASLFFVPRSALAISAGLIWGMGWGIVYALAGGMAGAFVGFVVARYLNAGWIVPENLPKFGHLLQRMERGGWRMVTMLRLVPVMPHTPVNYAFALTRVTLRDYLIGTALGLIPSTVYCVDFGAAGGKVAAGEGGWLIPSLIGFAALALSILLPRLLRRRVG
jgi:uncharacterized membrane protein YdjX (TVP38/TMEM64 family)